MTSQVLREISSILPELDQIAKLHQCKLSVEHDGSFLSIKLFVDGDWLTFSSDSFEAFRSGLVQIASN